MSSYFFDTSALIKRYVLEQGSAWVKALTAPETGNTIVVAEITQVEAVSGANRRKRDGQITANTVRAVRLLVTRHFAREYVLVGLTNPVIERAKDLLEAHPLRAYDAVQLASALESNSRLTGIGTSPLIFISADARLLAAAVAEGLANDDPSAHP